MTACVSIHLVSYHLDVLSGSFDRISVLIENSKD